jgi:hypothetical protein
MHACAMPGYFASVASDTRMAALSVPDMLATATRMTGCVRCATRRLDGTAFPRFSGHTCGGSFRLATAATAATRPAFSEIHHPPTLREWLGPRVSELGRWTDVLREQPVPAGWIKRWEWSEDFEVWNAYGRDSMGYTLEESDMRRLTSDTSPFMECLQMALFTRHPDVKPEPKLRTWFGNEEDV